MGDGGPWKKYLENLCLASPNLFWIEEESIMYNLKFYRWSQTVALKVEVPRVDGHWAVR